MVAEPHPLMSFARNLRFSVTPKEKDGAIYLFNHYLYHITCIFQFVTVAA